jgi:methylated-DNA-[protein]-cysteine S-methyltransferase/AraC family transcriptional regulator of adaptative response/methylated-DNA-[protein]-cysteine methyltransferase
MTLIKIQDVLKRHSAPSPAAAGETISFTVGESALGQILVARSATGIIAILIGGETAELEADLAARFPEARLARDDAAIREDLAKVMRFLETPAAGLDLSLDLRGTPFQRRVWEALRLIPAGTTTTYTAIAHDLDAPKAVRAVATACAANPIALAVPCHRVVRSDGNLAGYRWGIERKRVLLNRETMA